MKRALLVGGTVNQHRMLAAVAAQLPELDCTHSPLYVTQDRFFRLLLRVGILRHTLGHRTQGLVREALHAQGLPTDPGGRRGPYDLVILGTDLYVPRNLRGIPKVLVQEGMMLPGGLRYRLAKHTPIPHGAGRAHATGLSYDYEYFCVASEGFRQAFIRSGLSPTKVVGTGMPGYDDILSHRDRPCEFREFILVLTQCLREDWHWEFRGRLLRRARRLARGRTIVVKTHPRENQRRAAAEIRRHLPEALLLEEADTPALIAHCDGLLTVSSTALFNALVLGTPVLYCRVDLERLRGLLPTQHGRAAENIAEVCRRVLSRG